MVFNLGKVEAPKGEANLYPLTPFYRGIDLSDIRHTAVEINTAQGVGSLPKALEKITPDPQKREAIRRRIVAAGYSADLFKDGDKLIFDVPNMTLIVEKAGHRYAIPLVDKGHDDYPLLEQYARENDYTFLEEGVGRGKIKIKTRRAWKDLQEAADQGILHRVLKLLEIDSQDWKKRLEIWEALKEDVKNHPELKETLQKHRQLHNLDRILETPEYKGTGIENRLMIEYLRWKSSEETSAAGPKVPPPIPRGDARMGYRVNEEARNFQRVANLPPSVTVANLAELHREGKLYMVVTPKGRYTISSLPPDHARYLIEDDETKTSVFGYLEGIDRPVVEATDIRRVIEAYERNGKQPLRSSLDWQQGGKEPPPPPKEPEPQAPALKLKVELPENFFKLDEVSRRAKLNELAKQIEARLAPKGIHYVSSLVNSNNETGVTLLVLRYESRQETIYIELKRDGSCEAKLKSKQKTLKAANLEALVTQIEKEL